MPRASKAFVSSPRRRLDLGGTAGVETLREGKQQYDDRQARDGAGNRPGEEDRPIVREADHGIHEVLLGDRPEDDAEHERRDREFQALEAEAEDAEYDDQPEVGHVVADRQGADEAQDED